MNILLDKFPQNTVNDKTRQTFREILRNSSSREFCKMAPPVDSVENARFLEGFCDRHFSAFLPVAVTVGLGRRRKTGG